MNNIMKFSILLVLLVAYASAEVTDTLDEFANELKKAEDEINKENKKFAEGKANFEEKLYPFSDLTPEEFKREKTGLIPDSEVRGLGLVEIPEEDRINTPEMQEKLDDLYAQNRVGAPRSFSAKRRGWTTPAKSQGSCGSCAAFAATGLHETCMAKAGAANGEKDNLDLSEQYIIDCAYKKKQGYHGSP